MCQMTALEAVLQNGYRKDRAEASQIVPTQRNSGCRCAGPVQASFTTQKKVHERTVNLPLKLICSLNPTITVEVIW